MINTNTNPVTSAMNMLVTQAKNGDCGCETPRTHKVPRMPIMIDQAKANPLDVRAFVGKPLHTVVDADALDRKMLQIFTSEKTAQSYAQSSLAAMKRRRQAAQPASTPQPLTEWGYIDLFEHIDFGGCEWHVVEQNNGTVGRYSDLWCGILWWAKNADNRVSSADVNVSADLVTFFDLPGLDLPNGSATITFAGDSWIPNLVEFGWNDRISSHLLWYLS